MYTMRPQSQIDSVGKTQICWLGHQTHSFLHRPLKKLLIAAGLWPLHFAVGRIDADQIDVA